MAEKVNQKVTVYGLHEVGKPHEIRYIGQTRRGAIWRVYGHRTLARGERDIPVLNWIRSLWARGSDFTARPLVEGAEPDKVERRLIAKYRKTGNLLNVSDGGSGGLGRKMSKESRRKIGDKNRGRKKPQDAIERYKKWRKTFSPPSPSQEARQKMREAKLGKPSWAKGLTDRWSPEQRERISQQSRTRIKKNGHPMEGKSHSEATRRKISQSLTGKKLPESTRQKMREAHARRREAKQHG